jgi:succinate dehydrogenase / fumarate reductase flavoprotein subunit
VGAIAAHDAGADVDVVSKLHPTRSHSGAAEGGINAALEELERGGYAGLTLSR